MNFNQIASWLCKWNIAAQSIGKQLEYAACPINAPALNFLCETCSKMFSFLVWNFHQYTRFNSKFVANPMSINFINKCPYTKIVRIECYHGDLSMLISIEKSYFEEGTVHVKQRAKHL